MDILNAVRTVFAPMLSEHQLADSDLALVDLPDYQVEMGRAVKRMSEGVSSVLVTNISGMSVQFNAEGIRCDGKVMAFTLKGVMSCYAIVFLLTNTNSELKI